MTQKKADKIYNYILKHNKDNKVVVLHLKWLYSISGSNETVTINVIGYYNNDKKDETFNTIEIIYAFNDSDVRSRIISSPLSNIKEKEYNILGVYDRKKIEEIKKRYDINEDDEFVKTEFPEFFI